MKTRQEKYHDSSMAKIPFFFLLRSLKSRNPTTTRTPNIADSFVHRQFCETKHETTLNYIVLFRSFPEVRYWESIDLMAVSSSSRRMCFFVSWSVGSTGIYITGETVRSIPKGWKRRSKIGDRIAFRTLPNYQQL